jgi:hypothetical protein
MAAAAASVDDPAVARLVILWKRPYRLSADEARDWARAVLAPIAATDSVRRTELAPVRGATDRHPTDFDWMLEVELGPEGDAGDFVDDPAVGAWLGDLQQLGLEPRVIVVDGGVLVRPDRG